MEKTITFTSEELRLISDLFGTVSSLGLSGMTTQKTRRIPAPTSSTKRGIKSVHKLSHPTPYFLPFLPILRV